MVGTGAETNYYNIPGAKEHTLSLKNLSEALAIRNKIIDLCEEASRTVDPEARKKLLSFVVVGGGPTGVELVAEIQEFVEETLALYFEHPSLKKEFTVSLISAGKDLLSGFDPKLRLWAEKQLQKKGVTVKLNMAVTNVTPDAISFGDGSTMQSSCTLWVAGVKAHYPKIEGLVYDPSGRIVVEETLQAKSQPDIFILGDASFHKDTKGSVAPMLAQVASKEATTVACNIQALIRGQKLHPFIFRPTGVLVSLGQWYAIGKIGPFRVRGRFAWWLWRTVYLFKFISWRKRIKIALEWTINLFYPRDITKVR